MKRIAPSSWSTSAMVCGDWFRLVVGFWESVACCARVGWLLCVWLICNTVPTARDISHVSFCFVVAADTRSHTNTHEINALSLVGLKLLVSRLTLWRCFSRHSAWNWTRCHNMCSVIIMRACTDADKCWLFSCARTQKRSSHGFLTVWFRGACLLWYFELYIIYLCLAVTAFARRGFGVFCCGCWCWYYYAGSHALTHDARYITYTVGRFMLPCVLERRCWAMLAYVVHDRVFCAEWSFSLWHQSLI